MSTKSLSKTYSNLEEQNQNATTSNQNLNQNLTQRATSKSLSKAVTFHPRIKELLNDKIFRYFFTSYYNSKDYSEFRGLTDTEKLNFMIDLYFFIMVDLNKDTIFDIKDLSTEEQISNINGEIMDRLLMLKDEISRKNVIKSIEKYQISSITEQNSLNQKFKEILAKYKYSNLDKLRAERENKENLNTSNNLRNSILKNTIRSDFKSGNAKETLTLNNEENLELKKSLTAIIDKEKEHIDFNAPNNPDTRLETKGPIFGSTRMKSSLPTGLTGSPEMATISKAKSFIKIDIGKVNLINMGGIHKDNNYYVTDEKTKEALMIPNKLIYISKHNSIQDSTITHYVCNNRVRKLKHPKVGEFVMPLNYKTLSNPKRVCVVNQANSLGGSSGFGATKSRNNTKISLQNCKTKNNFGHSVIIQDAFVFEEGILNPPMICQNVVVAKGCEKDMDELIKKIFLFDEEEIKFNKNEINKIGVLLIEYIRLEKKMKEINGRTFGEKDKLSKIKQVLDSYSKSIQDRITKSKKFINDHQ